MNHNASSETTEQQTHVIRKYCSEAEKVLAGAPDYAAAVRLKSSLCARFADECSSELVVNATSRYLDQMLSKRWGKSDLVRRDE